MDFRYSEKTNIDGVMIKRRRNPERGESEESMKKSIVRMKRLNSRCWHLTKIDEVDMIDEANETKILSKYAEEIFKLSIESLKTVLIYGEPVMSPDDITTGWKPIEAVMLCDDFSDRPIGEEWDDVPF